MLSWYSRLIVDTLEYVRKIFRKGDDKKMKKYHSYILMSAATLLTSAVFAMTVPNVEQKTVLAATDISATKWNMHNLVALSGTGISIFNYQDLNIKSLDDVYNISNQNKIAQMLDEVKASNYYSFENPLIISNPFLTNSSGLYVYFHTNQPAKISYTVKAKDYADYSATAYNPNGSYSNLHEFQLIGAVAGVENTITLTEEIENGSKISQTFTFKPNDLQANISNTYKVKKGSSKAPMSDGLFAVIGMQDSKIMRSTALVDNNGVIRGGFPIKSYNSMRLVSTNDHQIYLGISPTEMVRINRLGRVTQVVGLTKQGYEFHHDFTVDSNGDIWALANSIDRYNDGKYVEDQIIKIDHNTGKVVSAIDAQKLLPSLYKVATGKVRHLSDSSIGNRDIMHFNSIVLPDDNSMLLSSRETSTIIKLTDINSKPKISYMIGDSSVWSGVGSYSKLLLKKSGKFLSSAGQHSLVYEKPSNLKSGQYYLSMFNNNYGIMDSRPKFSWANYKKQKTGSVTLGSKKSLYYKYLVDEKAKTYKLVSSLPVTQSRFVSAIEYLDNNLIVASGQANSFTEYDSKHKAIKTFTYRGKSPLTYRTLKYDFKQFYFE